MKNLNNLKQLGISFGIGIISILILLLFITTLYYFNLINNKLFLILELIIPVFSCFISGIRMGRHSKQKGWLVGLETGTLFFLFFLLFAFLGLHHKFQIQNFIYYIAMITSSIFGGMIGINHSKKD